MTDLLGKLCRAIAQQEGYFANGDNLPKRNKNPGDLRAAPWLPSPKIVNGYWVADSDAMGIAGLYHQVALNVARGYTLRKLLQAWAPASDGNNEATYLANVMSGTGIYTPDVPLWDLLEL